MTVRIKAYRKWVMLVIVKGRENRFVSVGTTSFDALVRVVDTPEVIQELFSKGYTHLPIQMGRIPTKDLMNNRQSELAEELAERKHLFCAHPQTLLHTIKGVSLEILIPYHPGDARPVAKLINRFLGFPDD